MSDRDHPIDEAIRRAFPDVEPSDEARQIAKNRLLAAIEAEKARESRRRRWPWKQRPRSLQPGSSGTRSEVSVDQVLIGLDERLNFHRITSPDTLTIASQTQN